MFFIFKILRLFCLLYFNFFGKFFERKILFLNLIFLFDIFPSKD
jgi:hypothetical protein